MKYFMLAFFILLVAGLIFIGIPYTDNQIKIESKEFNEANISGKLIKVSLKHHGNSFRINNNKIEFVFYPITDKVLNQNNYFGNMAKEGDSIYKAAFSDTLLLIKNKNIYKYCFTK